MKNILFLVFVLIGFSALASEKIMFSFKDGEITKAIEIYAQASKKQFIVDSTVRGKITILNPAEITIEEAYEQLSEALAINGFAIIKQGETLTVRNARSAQRDNIPVSTELPSAKPQRMATWVVNLKNIAANDVINIRLLTSSYGEMSVNHEKNQLIISDWTSNLQRISEVIKQADIPTPEGVAKFVTKANSLKAKELLKEKVISEKDEKIKKNK